MSRKKLIYVSCSPELRATISDHADKQGMKITEWMSMAIDEKLQRDDTELDEIDIEADS